MNSASELIRRFRKPLVSTSANLSGKPSPENFSEIDKSVIEAADYVVKYRQDDRRKYSSSPVIKLGPDGTIKDYKEITYFDLTLPEPETLASIFGLPG